MIQSTVRPSPIDLGVNYAGAIIEGSLHIAPATEIHEFRVGKANEIDVLELFPYLAARGGLIWKYRVQTCSPMRFNVFVDFQTDLGKTSTHFSLEVKNGPPPGGRVLCCQSPFDAFSSEVTHANINLIARELRIQLNSAYHLPEDLLVFDVIVLQGAGLGALGQNGTKAINSYLEAGGRVILFADYFFRSSVLHANAIAEPYGIRLEDREYTELMCESSDITDHLITAGISRLRWFRPSPIIVSKSANIIVRNPEKY